MRVYRKRALEQRRCVHCAKPFESARKRRIYCGSSCSTLAYCARRAQPAPADGRTLAISLPRASRNAHAGRPSVGRGAPLPLELQTVGVVAAGTMVGTVRMRLRDKLLEPAPVPAALPVKSLPLATVLVAPASWFPAAVLAAPTATLPVRHPEWPQAQVCLQLHYFGRRFYYQPTLRRLVQQFLPHLKTKKTAAILNVTSGLALTPFPLAPIYGGTKAGLRAYTKALRVQLQHTPVKVFELVAPAAKTPLADPFAGVLDEGMLMDLGKVIAQAIHGLQHDTLEIYPGLSRVMRYMSRLAPGVLLKQMSKGVTEAFKQPQSKDSAR